MSFGRLWGAAAGGNLSDGFALTAAPLAAAFVLYLLDELVGGIGTVAMALLGAV